MTIALIVLLTISIALVIGICYFKRLERKQNLQLVQVLDEVEYKQILETIYKHKCQDQLDKIRREYLENGLWEIHSKLDGFIKNK